MLMSRNTSSGFWVLIISTPSLTLFASPLMVSSGQFLLMMPAIMSRLFCSSSIITVVIMAIVLTYERHEQFNLCPKGLVVRVFQVGNGYTQLRIVYVIQYFQPVFGDLHPK